MKQNGRIGRNLFFVLFYFIFILTGCTAQNSLAVVQKPLSVATGTEIPIAEGQETEQRAEVQDREEIPKEPEILEARIAVTGDLMVHSYQYEEAYQEESGTYDFLHNFQDVKKYFDKADLTIGNLETTFAGEEVGISDYPLFNTPDSFAVALKEAGFDVLTTVNNHCLDKKQAGLLRTLDVLDNLGIAHTGTFRSQEERDTILFQNVNGIQVAILAYTYGTNGLPIPEPYQVNLLEEDLIRADIARAKEEGADFIIVMPHMGIEYELSPRETYQNWAAMMLAAGADAVLASHPHVLQPMEYKTITEEDGSKRTGFIIYSLGNFISSQTTPPRNAGVILNLELMKEGDAHAQIKQVSVIPVWTQFRGASGKNHFVVRSVYEMLKLPEEEQTALLRQKDITRLKEIHTETTEMLLKKEIPLEEIKEEYFVLPPEGDTHKEENS